MINQSSVLMVEGYIRSFYIVGGHFPCESYAGLKLVQAPASLPLLSLKLSETEI